MVKLMPNPNMSTHDLRNQAKQRKRDLDHKYKWYHKAVKEGPNGTVRPRQLRDGARVRGELRDASRRNNAQRKLPVLNDDTNRLEDSSADESVTHENDAAQTCLDDIKYSFDAPRGPANGRDILGLAVAKAVEKYEDEKTNKLVSEEYEVLDSISEADAETSGEVYEDEGFELI